MNKSIWRWSDFKFDKASLKKPSVIALIAANLFPFAGVIFLGWDVFSLLALFWLENLIIGFYTAVKMLLIPRANAGWASKASLIPFFCLHYGIFTLVHGMFILGLFGGLFTGESSSIALLWQKILDSQLGWGGLVLLTSHGISLFRNYLGEGEYKTSHLQQVMMQPYSRVVILHLTIMFGGFLLMILGSPMAGLLVLTILKTGMDVFTHLREHNKSQGKSINEIEKVP